MAMRRADEADDNQASPEDKRAENYVKCKEQSSKTDALYLTDDAQALFYHGKPFYIIKPNDVKYTESERLNPSVDEVREAIGEVEAEKGNDYTSSGKLTEKELSDIIRRNRGEAVLLDTIEFQVDWHDWVTSIIKGSKAMAGEGVDDYSRSQYGEFDSGANQSVISKTEGIESVIEGASVAASELNKSNRYIVKLYQTENTTQAVIMVFNEKAPQYLIPNTNGAVVAIGDYLRNGGFGTYESIVEDHFYDNVNQMRANENE